VKRIVITILAFLYLGIASGITVSVHFCMGDLASVEYGIPSDKDCSKCGMKEKKGCCHTESKLVKIQDEHQWVKESFSFSQLPVEVSSVEINTIPVLAEKELLALQYHSPPDPRVNEVYLHNCVFRI
jgi:hypothetical protein